MNTPLTRTSPERKPTSEAVSQLFKNRVQVRGIYLYPFRPAFNFHRLEPCYPGCKWGMMPSTTRGDIFDAFLDSFDYALPEWWIKEKYWDKGKGTPVAVWSYDNNRTMGEPVFMADLLEQLGHEAEGLN